MVSAPFECSVPVRWGGVDSCEAVNNAAYLSDAEQALWMDFQSLGLLDDGRFPFVLGETKLRSLRPLSARSQLRVLPEFEGISATEH